MGRIKSLPHFQNGFLLFYDEGYHKGIGPYHVHVVDLSKISFGAATELESKGKNGFSDLHELKYLVGDAMTTREATEEEARYIRKMLDRY